jgi:hypothetical protein
MTDAATAAVHLATGDAINQQLREGASLEAAAAQLAITRSWAGKLVWLSRTFTPADRDEIGGDNLTRLGITHLEAIAAQAEHLRIPLLKAAAEERLSVRKLRKRAAELRSSRYGEDSPAEGVEQFGGPAAMQSTARALERYAGMPKDQFLRIYAGKSGPYIADVIRAAHELESRITQEGGGIVTASPSNPT